MKHFHLMMVVAFLCVHLIGFGQADCKVLDKNIAESYAGKCKKGLANGKGIARGVDSYMGVFKSGLPDGKGTYTWANGDYYEGSWKAGERHGEGIYVFLEEGEKKIQDGIWENDVYKGARPVKPKVNQSVSIYRHQFQKLSNDGNNVAVNIYLGGANNTDLDQFSIYGSSGTQYQTGATVGFDNIVFPFVCKVSYYTWNQMRSSRYYAVFEFEIIEPGRWNVKLYNK